MKTYKNSLNEKVTLTGKTCTNSNGDTLLWVRCENGAVVSIMAGKFQSEFKPTEK